MKELILMLVAVQVVIIIFKNTLLGRLILTTTKIMWKLSREILLMNYRTASYVYKFVNKKHKQHKVRTLKKAVGCENVIDLSKYKIKCK